MSDQPKSSSSTRSAPEVLSQHQLKGEVERRVILLLIASILIMTAALLWSVYRWYFAFARFGPAVVWRWSGPAIGITFLAFILAIFSGVFLIRNRKRIIYTTADGVWLINGGNRRALQWPEIESIRSSAARYLFSGSAGDPQLRIWLRTAEQEVIHLPSFLTHLSSGQRVIKQHIYPLAMDRYREMMKSGRALRFGPIELSQRGIVHRNRTEPWQNFRQVHLESGRLQIEFQGSKGSRKLSIPARRVPNVDLCVQLLRNIEY